MNEHGRQSADFDVIIKLRALFAYKTEYEKYAQGDESPAENFPIKFYIQHWHNIDEWSCVMNFFKFKLFYC